MIYRQNYRIPVIELNESALIRSDSEFIILYYIVQWFYDNYNLILLVYNVALAEPVMYKITESNMYVPRY